nr:GNAT family N-acetyltransferase [uncultured Clostridium sp.]
MLIRKPQDRFEEIYVIYEESFPDQERRTKEGQRNVSGNPAYQIRAVEEDGKIKAFLGYWDLPGCVFFEHLATAKVSRGKGYGKLLIEEAVRETKKPVFLEIEPVTRENPITGKRAVFYERLGFYVNHFYYEQMPLKPQDSPMQLWVTSYGTPISEEAFLPYKKEIYEIVYGVSLS